MLHKYDENDRGYTFLFCAAAAAAASASCLAPSTSSEQLAKVASKALLAANAASSFAACSCDCKTEDAISPQLIYSRILKKPVLYWYKFHNILPQENNKRIIIITYFLNVSFSTMANKRFLVPQDILY